MYVDPTNYKCDRYEMFREISNPHRGRIIQIEGDMRHYYLQSHQKWVPHVVPSTDHPAEIGDMLTATDFMASYLGASIFFVAGIRTFREFRSETQGTRQVELMGLPCRWFPIKSFKEYLYLPYRPNEQTLVVGA